MSNAYEIEIKSLLGNKEAAGALKEKLMGLPKPALFTGKEKQINHYFYQKNLKEVERAFAPYFEKHQRDKLSDIFSYGSDFSIRTRLVDDSELYFVVKASIDQGTSANTISRKEFQERISGTTIQEIDALLLGLGLTHQSKWSREREIYNAPSHEIDVTIDKNAGYGYVAEFEKIVETSGDPEEAKEDLYAFMEFLDVEEIDPARLERMFAHYNDHWEEYYGTDKVFLVE